MAPRKQLGITCILREAFLCLHWNHKLLLSSLFLILIPLNHLRQLPTLNPLLNATYIIAKRFHIQLYPVNLITSYLTELVVVYFSLIAYNGRNFRTKDLQSKCKRTWKGSAITLLYARFMPFASRGFYLILLALLQKMVTLRVALNIIILSMIFLFGVVSLYVGIVAKVSLVVSIVEEGCYGLPALRRAESLVRGRKLDGFVVMVLRFMFVEVLHLVIGAIDVDQRGNGWQLSVIMKVAAAILLHSLVRSLSSLYTHLVYAVYYDECRRSEP